MDRRPKLYSKSDLSSSCASSSAARLDTGPGFAETGPRRGGFDVKCFEENTASGSGAPMNCDDQTELSLSDDEQGFRIDHQDEDLAALEARFDAEAEYRAGLVPRSPSPLSSLSSDSSSVDSDDDLEDAATLASQISLSQDGLALDSEAYCREMLDAHAECPVVPAWFMNRMFAIAAKYFVAYHPPRSWHLAKNEAKVEESLVEVLKYACEECGKLIEEPNGRCCRRRGCAKAGIPLHALNHGYVHMNIKRQLQDLVRGEVF